jgi:hypothetical protein
MIATDRMPLLYFLRNAAVLPFCNPSYEDTTTIEFPCGLTIIDTDSNYLEIENYANKITDSVRYTHAKHHIDGHTPASHSWDIVIEATQIEDSESHYVTRCGCGGT